ncbi:DUF6415 family natural product biosynthesis protein [Streptomyces chrestomyceticus]|uniref:DUF6415 family natural product biosynthesis protein n=1 Tax=Streptomyces chrestomyceticus TaxID=68185 RepID=UPI0019CF8E99|nr:DUF6415 family natural product biosynthesis protein [Streptomyces chrestomyceticus]
MGDQLGRPTAYESLVAIVLAWPDEPALHERDYVQIALQLTGHARAVAADLQQHAVRLPKDSGRRALAEVVLGEADRRLTPPLQGTVRCTQNGARMVRALYERLDRLTDHIR